MSVNEFYNENEMLTPDTRTAELRKFTFEDLGTTWKLELPFSDERSVTKGQCHQVFRRKTFETPDNPKVRPVLEVRQNVKSQLPPQIRRRRSTKIREASS